MAFSRSCREENTSLSAVASELEAIRCVPSVSGAQFPPACQNLLHRLPGNSRCIDCSAPRPKWASVSYGVMLCVQCAGRHRSYGVMNSVVKSVDMDTWNQTQVLAMLEGGNEQLGSFFERHQMGTVDMTCQRYKTKAALFYRTHLKKHVDQVACSGPYQGREATRRSHRSETGQHQRQQQTMHVDKPMRNTIQQQGIAAS